MIQSTVLHSVCVLQSEYVMLGAEETEAHISVAYPPLMELTGFRQAAAHVALIEMAKRGTFSVERELEMLVRTVCYHFLGLIQFVHGWTLFLSLSLSSVCETACVQGHISGQQSYFQEREQHSSLITQLSLH